MQKLKYQQRNKFYRIFPKLFEILTFICLFIADIKFNKLLRLQLSLSFKYFMVLSFLGDRGETQYE